MRNDFKKLQDEEVIEVIKHKLLNPQIVFDTNYEYFRCVAEFGLLGSAKIDFSCDEIDKKVIHIFNRGLELETMEQLYKFSIPEISAMLKYFRNILDDETLIINESQ